MRIAIIGAGAAGVSSAYELAAAGHQVTVFERRGSVAAEGSFGHGGALLPALALPWTAPSFPGPSAGGSWLWQWQRWRAARDKNAAETQDRLLLLARFSLNRLQQLRRHLQLDHERAEGQLVLLRHEKDLKAAQAGLARLARLGLPHRELSPAECLQLEPGLNPEMALHAGIALPGAEVGNCRQFCHLLRLEAQRLGARFRFHSTVLSLSAGTPWTLTHQHTPGDEQLGWTSSARDSINEDGDTLPTPRGPQEEHFDAIVLCAGSGALPLLHEQGLKAPWRLVQTQSITAPLRHLEAHPELGPAAGLVDQQRQISISRIGQRVRVSQHAHWQIEAGGLKQPEMKALHQTLNDWFPGAMQAGQVQRWLGLHAVLADGLPLLGSSGRSGLWLNLGQQSLAHSGWTLACGSAAMLTRLIKGGQDAAGTAPPLQDPPDIHGLDFARLA